jgi:protein-disulfide isomerase
MGYLFLMGLLAFSLKKEIPNERTWALFFWISFLYSAYSIVLALISTYVIHSYCIMCIVTYGVNFALMWFSWLIRKRFSSCSLMEDTLSDAAFLRHQPLKSLVCFSLIPVAIILAISFFPAYWKLEPPPSVSHITTGISRDGHPWIGAEDPVLEITEYTDYQCFQCKKLHFFLRQLIANHPGKIRLVHRHFPIDHQFNPIVKSPFHIGSGQMALLAIYATPKDQFWLMSDLLFEMAGQGEPIGLKKIAKITGFSLEDLNQALDAPAIRRRLMLDIAAGIKHGITGTPAYVIDDKLHQGQIPPDVIAKALR